MVHPIREFKATLKILEVEELADVYFYRPLAFLLVKAVAWTPITPNQLTIASLLIGIAGGVCYGLGRPSTVVLGAGLYALSIVVDCADGQLARLKRNGTPLGRILDGMIDYVVTIAVYVGVAVGLDPGPGRRTFWLLLLAAAGASNIFHSAILDYYRFRFMERAQGERRDEDAEYAAFQAELAALSGRPGDGVRRTVIRIYLRYLALQKRMTRSRGAAKPVAAAEREAFYRANRAVMRGWTFLGSTTLGSLMILATLVQRIDVYFWGRIVVANALAAVLFAFQMRADRRLGLK